ncbi:MAG: hypothetical protein OXU23_12750 [Candidatus Poribacteria bacterium]|nr:hypothetical protein [Candidatus Poribacteria bacterium]
MDYDYVPNEPNFYGNKDFQIIAREAFPILIDLATDPVQPTMTYGQLAERVGRNVDRFSALRMTKPLGSIWTTLLRYQEKSGIDIPYLTIIIVDQDRGLPTYFRNNLDWSYREIANAQADVYNFQQWIDVREHTLPNTS